MPLTSTTRLAGGAHCREQQGVIAPRAFAANGPGSEASQAVRL